MNWIYLRAITEVRDFIRTYSGQARSAILRVISIKVRSISSGDGIFSPSE